MTTEFCIPRRESHTEFPRQWTERLPLRRRDSTSTCLCFFNSVSWGCMRLNTAPNINSFSCCQNVKFLWLNTLLWFKAFSSKDSCTNIISFPRKVSSLATSNSLLDSYLIKCGSRAPQAPNYSVKERVVWCDVIRRKKILPRRSHWPKDTGYQGAEPGCDYRAGLAVVLGQQMWGSTVPKREEGKPDELNVLARGSQWDTLFSLGFEF